MRALFKSLLPAIFASQNRVSAGTHLANGNARHSYCVERSLIYSVGESRPCGRKNTDRILKGGSLLWKAAASVIATGFALVGLSSEVSALCTSYPYSLANGTTADAMQVMANFRCAVLSSGGTIENANISLPSASGGGGWLLAGGTTSIVAADTAGNSFLNVPSGGKLHIVTGGLTTSPKIVTITAGGNIGVGTPSPTFPLEVISPTNTIPVRIASDATDGTQFALVLDSVGINSNYAGISLRTGGSQQGAITQEQTGNIYIDASANLLLRPGSNVGIGTIAPGQKLDVAGTVRQSGCTTAGTLAVNASGDIICSSDARLKKIRGRYTGGLEKIARLRPVLFTFKPTKKDPNETFVHAGFIAQEVRAVIPQASALQKDGYYSLDTTAILAASINALKELKAESDSQKLEILRLHHEVAELQERMAKGKFISEH